MAVKLLLRALVFILLKLLTQVGGVIYLLSILLWGLWSPKVKTKLQLVALKSGLFLSLYLITTFLIVPPVAEFFGRVPLPLAETHHLKPLNRLTCLLNRNYVRPRLRDCAFAVAEDMNTKHPGTALSYLDANLPFISGFPLVPHWSHNDGRKLDLAFCYLDSKTGRELNASPSFIGYGVSEGPRPGEENKTEFCEEKGYLQYGLLNKIVPQWGKDDFVFDSVRTKSMVELLVAQKDIRKAFIEPHLRARLGLNSDKIRFHGCHAVRHDDHLHIEM